MLQYDLHCHSTRSDGVLSPRDVVRRAAERGVDVLALTDHDELAGLDEAREAAQDAGIVLVAGSELSVTWQDETIHVLGLGIDPCNTALGGGLSDIRRGRDERARRIGEALESVGIPDAFEGALTYVTSERLISRTHFARYLVETGHVRDLKDAFKRYLTAGKPGYVPHAWASLSQAVTWIRGAGGQAVIAHPGRYRVTTSELRKLVAEFRDLGGAGLEVVSPSHSGAEYAEFAALARSHGLRASCGSDFHGPGESHLDFGDLPPMPVGVEPVWSAW
jgi:3',5'-nucleoside bisphosphate phosphatase